MPGIIIIKLMLNGQTYPQPLNASMSLFAGSLNNATSKSLSASMASFAGSLSKGLSYAFNAGMAAWAGTETRTTGKSLSGSMAPWAGSLGFSHMFSKAFAAAMSAWAGALQTGHGVSIAFTASMAAWAGTLVGFIIGPIPPPSNNQEVRATNIFQQRAINNALGTASGKARKIFNRILPRKK